MDNLPGNLKGGSKANPQSKPGTLIPSGFSALEAGSVTSSAEQSAGRLNRAIAQITEDRNPLKEVARREQASEQRKRGRDESEEPEGAPSPKRRRADATAEKENFDVESGDESDVEVVGAKGKGKAKVKETEVSKKPAAKKAKAAPGTKAAAKPKPKPKGIKSTKKQVDKNGEEGSDPGDAAACRSKDQGSGEDEDEDEEIAGPKKKGSKNAPPAGEQQAETPAPKKKAPKKAPATAAPFSTDNVDPALDNAEFFPEIREAMKLKRPFPAGNMRHIEAYMSGYGFYVAGQSFLHSERVLVRQLDRDAVEDRHRQEVLDIQKEELKLRTREIELKERELVLRERELEVKMRGA
ncbi:hypothetical protein C8R45DRAFT_983517 [Mycena sanguinolenta]|nr:hypothetical protein C8R45DRAFT_983517 [Mycena sanguinolenta]